MKLFKVLFLSLFFTTLGFSGVKILKDVKLQNSELVLSFGAKFDVKSIKKFTLTHPDRQVFDFRNTRLRDSDIGKKFPKHIRIAQFKANIVRVVIQNRKSYLCKPYTPMLTEKEIHIPLGKNLLSHSKQRSALSTKIKTRKRSAKSINDIFSEVEMVKRSSRRKLTHRAKKVRSVQPLPPVRHRSNGRDLIVIDAGHGGHDSGAVGAGKREKDLVLSIAKRTAKALRRHGYSVYLTRSEDRFLKLSQRTKIADRKGAVAFISIHANSVPKRKRHKIHGIETFFLQTTRDAKSQRIAARENAAVLKGAGSSLSKKVIVDSVLNGPKIIESNKLAIDVQRRIISNVRSKYSGVKDGGVRHAPFYVLVGASRPSILVEVGYISHPRERKRLFRPAYQNLIAKGIAEGVNNYLNTRKKEIDID